MRTGALGILKCRITIIAFIVIKNTQRKIVNANEGIKVLLWWKTSCTAPLTKWNMISTRFCNFLGTSVARTATYRKPPKMIIPNMIETISVSKLSYQKPPFLSIVNVFKLSVKCSRWCCIYCAAVMLLASLIDWP